MDKYLIRHTEEDILKAAKEVFLEKGMEGARMQEIADKAKINKALLHYYFRSKEKLFRHIFENLLRNVFQPIKNSINQKDDIFVFIETFVDNYTRVLSQNPNLPNFIINEINRNPDRIRELIDPTKLDKNFIQHLIDKSVKSGKIHPVSAEHLLIDMLGMCVFPILSRPIVEYFLFENQSDQYHNFLSERNRHIVDLLTRALTL